MSNSYESSPTTALEASQYDVALSFAGEDRVYVEQVASALRQAGVRLFYDRYEQAELWGEDLVTRLDDVYRKHSRFVVMFVSKHYATKVWPNHERRSALARAVREQGPFVLPARIDDTDLPGLADTIRYEDCRLTTPRELADLVVQKIHRIAASSYGFGHADEQLVAPAIRHNSLTLVECIRVEPRRYVDRLRVMVTNLGPIGEFEAQILDVQERDTALPFPWTVPWATGAPRQQILREQGHLLDVVRFDHAAGRSMWNGHAIGGPFVFLDASRMAHDGYCDSMIANDAAEMALIRVCVRLVIFRVDPPDRLELTVRFGFFEGDDLVAIGGHVCTPVGATAIRAARLERNARIAAIKERIRTDLVTARFHRFELRAGEEDQIVEFLFEVGLGNIGRETRLAVDTIHLEDGSTEDRLRPEDIFRSALRGVTLNLAADGTEHTLRLIQNVLQEDLMPAIVSLEWLQSLADAIKR